MTVIVWYGVFLLIIRTIEFWLTMQQEPDKDEVKKKKEIPRVVKPVVENKMKDEVVKKVVDKIKVKDKNEVIKEEEKRGLSRRKMSLRRMFLSKEILGKKYQF